MTKLTLTQLQEFRRIFDRLHELLPPVTGMDYMHRFNQAMISKGDWDRLLDSAEQALMAQECEKLFNLN